MKLAEQTILDLELCRTCGGRCCQGSPGLWADPQRFCAIFFGGQQLSLASMRLELPRLGLVLWEKSGVPIPAPASLVSGCSFCQPGGCSLSLAERPCQCLALIPEVATLSQAGCVCRLAEEYGFAQVKLAWAGYWNGPVGG